MLAMFSTLIPFFFNLVFFLVPIFLFTKTSELFEFNKMLLTYSLTILIVASWVSKMILRRRIVFHRTALDIPLVLFLGSQILSTLVSIDLRTSILGYYSRFHGGLLSSISYALLYWAYVANMDRKRTYKSIIFLLVSGLLVSIYGVLQHFGIDKDIWVQDVQTRVFSTLGQPNWLAAWLVALLPITWALALNSKFKVKKLRLKLKIQNYWIWVALSTLFFLTLSYTKSRSGLLGFVVAYFFFWIPTYALNTFNKKQAIASKKLNVSFGVITAMTLITAFIVGTPWTPSMPAAVPQKIAAPALEVGGTESGEIRKIVWKGAVEIWKNYPVLGTGVETFAFAYYNFRPKEHNLVSEWDFLYNKAHNEYLNFLATSGVLGLGSYLMIVAFFSVWVMLILANEKSRFMPILLHSHGQLIKTPQTQTLLISLFAGFASILVTNFFGFSVVPVALQFFLYPGIAFSLNKENGRAREQEYRKLSPFQFLGVGLVLTFTLLLFYSIARYWYADFVYARGKLENDSGNYAVARNLLVKATSLSPKEAIFWDELAETSSEISLTFHQKDDAQKAEEFANLAIAESGKATSLSPKNVNLKRKRASLFIKLSEVEPKYLSSARDTLVEATNLAPTDAKLFYNLALAHVRTQEPEKAIKVLEETIEMKKNYRNARFALALLLIDRGEKQKAKEQLELILEKIDPDDTLVKQELENLK